MTVLLPEGRTQAIARMHTVSTGLFGKTNAGHLSTTPAGLAGCVNTVCASEPGHTVWLKRQVESDR